MQALEAVGQAAPPTGHVTQLPAPPSRPTPLLTSASGPVGSAAVLPAFAAETAGALSPPTGLREAATVAVVPAVSTDPLSLSAATWGGPMEGAGVMAMGGHGGVSGGLNEGGLSVGLMGHGGVSGGQGGVSGGGSGLPGSPGGDPGHTGSTSTFNFPVSNSLMNPPRSTAFGGEGMGGAAALAAANANAGMGVPPTASVMGQWSSHLHTLLAQLQARQDCRKTDLQWFW